ncbi:hypothetical protein CFFPNG_03452 [Methylorubrum aminovorans]
MLPLGGEVVVPALNLLPGAFGVGIPPIEVYSPMASVVSDIVGSDPIRHGDGARLTVYASLVTSQYGTNSMLAGNDTIEGGAGDDLVVGDTLVLFQPGVARGLAVDDPATASAAAGIEAAVTARMAERFAAMQQHLAVDYPVDLKAVVPHWIASIAFRCDSFLGSSSGPSHRAREGRQLTSKLVHSPVSNRSSTVALRSQRPGLSATNAIWALLPSGICTVSSQ